MQNSWIYSKKLVKASRPEQSKEMHNLLNVISSKSTLFVEVVVVEVVVTVVEIVVSVVISVVEVFDEVSVKAVVEAVVEVVVVEVDVSEGVNFCNGEWQIVSKLKFWIFESW